MFWDQHIEVMTSTPNPKAATPPTSDLGRLPSKLSPSRAKDFLTCPLMFYRKSIERRPTKNTVQNTRGTLAHEALEELFRLPREERTVEKAHTYVKPAWDALKERKSYKDMVEEGSEEEARMLAYAREMVTNYFKIENPQAFDAGHLEYHAEAEIGGLALHGYIDRLDKAPIPSEGGTEKYLISDYKALTLDTPLPTPTGWTTMGEIKPGEYLLGSDGAPVQVLNKSKVHHDRRCFEVQFDNHFTITADEDHLWKVQYDNGLQEAVVTTATLIDLLAEHPDLAVPATQPVWMPYNPDLPVPPRQLGMWLGAGCPAEEAPHTEQHEELAAIQAGQRIPVQYLRASVEQRVGLLDGLLSNMTVVREENSLTVYCNSEELLESFDELIFSLGGISWPGEEPHSRVLPGKPITELRVRNITAVTEVDSQPTQCVEVDAPDALFLAGRAMIPTHNTGKIPSDRYLDDAFFAMRIYALLLYEETGEVPYMLRLIYLKGQNAQEAVRRVIVTPELLERTRRDIESIWKRIRTAAATGNWPTKTGPLCNWCDFKNICPAWGNEES